MEAKLDLGLNFKPEIPYPIRGMIEKNAQPVLICQNIQVLWSVNRSLVESLFSIQ